MGQTIHFSLVWPVNTGLDQGCPYSDDCFGTKKILVGFNAKTGKVARTSPWAHRLKNTKESVTLLFEMVHSQFSNTPATYRKRVTKLELEGKAEVTALACALSQYQKEVLVLLSKVPTKHNSKSVKHTTPYQVPLWKSSQAKFPMCKNRWRKSCWGSY